MNNIQYNNVFFEYLEIELIKDGLNQLDSLNKVNIENNQYYFQK